MKFLFTNVFIILIFTLKSQSTIVLKPNADEGKDALLYNNDNVNRGKVNYLAAAGWTNSGNPSIYRFLIQFDLSSIPDHAEILDARLNLFFPTNVDFFNGSQNGENKGVIERVLDDWDENTTNWENQPATSDENATIIYSLYNQENAMELNVFQLVKDMLSSNNNDGFLIKLYNETPYNNLVFASSDNANADLHPELIITYSTDKCVELKAGNDNAKDAIIHSKSTNVNRGNVDYIASAAWTNSGIDAVYKTLLQFDLPVLEDNQRVKYAGLNLYFTDELNYFNQKQYGENKSYISRITEDWNESVVTWDNSPNIDENSEVTVEQSVTAYQNYTNIDITDIIISSYAEGNFGFLIYPEKQDPYNNLYFASTEFNDPFYRPMLKVCYEETSSISGNVLKDVMLYPNPTKGEFKISNHPDIKSIIILDVMGRILKQYDALTDKIYSIDDLPSASYLVELLDQKNIVINNFTLVKTD